MPHDSLGRGAIDAAERCLADSRRRADLADLTSSRGTIVYQITFDAFLRAATTFGNRSGF
jgi:hypothetical protein